MALPKSPQPPSTITSPCCLTTLVSQEPAVSVLRGDIPGTQNMGPPAPTTEFGAALNQHPRMIPTHVRIYQCVTFMDHSLTVQAILLTVAATGTCHWG